MSAINIVLINAFRTNPPSMAEILDYFQKPGVEDHSSDVLAVLAYLNKSHPDQLRSLFELAYKREFETKPVNKNTFLSECFFTVFRGKLKSSELPVEIWKVFDAHKTSPDFLKICLFNWSTTLHVRGEQSQSSSVDELLQCYVDTPPDRPAPKRPVASAETHSPSTSRLQERPQKPLPKTPTKQSSPESLRVDLLKSKFEEASRESSPSPTPGKGTKPA